jgi:hypothetical protein
MVWLRAFAVWILLLLVESVHGVFRKFIVEPWTGDLLARQIGVFTGSVLVVIVTYLFINWIAAATATQLTFIGLMWTSLTLAFEIGVGRFVIHYSWVRVLSDFNPATGGLLGFGLLIMALAPRATASVLRVQASWYERMRRLPGDGRIPQSIASLTHAITILCSNEQLWPWLAQMGATRGGWYSYDLLDNGGRASADRILPQFQDISVDDLFPALPQVTEAFFVLDYQPAQYLVLGTLPHRGVPAATWAFVLQEIGPGQTRLIVRVRVSEGYSFHGLPLVVVKVIHYVMQRKQLLEIARRAEQWPLPLTTPRSACGIQTYASRKASAK